MIKYCWELGDSWRNFDEDFKLGNWWKIKFGGKCLRNPKRKSVGSVRHECMEIKKLGDYDIKNV